MSAKFLDFVGLSRMDVKISDPRANTLVLLMGTAVLEFSDLNGISRDKQFSVIVEKKDVVTTKDLGPENVVQSIASASLASFGNGQLGVEAAVDEVSVAPFNVGGTKGIELTMSLAIGKGVLNRIAFQVAVLANL